MSKAEDAKRHARLYKKLPSFACIEGCTDCCGPVPWTQWELSRAGLDAPPPERDDKKCAFSLAGNCAIHDRRPLMCRAFGTIADLTCPHGRGPLQLLSLADGHAIVAKYKRMVE